MNAFQFLANVDGPAPVVFDLAEIISEEARLARPRYEPMANLPGQWDHMGTSQLVYDISTINVSGQVYCRVGGRREPGERAAKRLLGQKGWLVAYRFDRCCCDTCGSECVCGSAASRNVPPSWYATVARLVQVDVASNAWANQNDGDQPVAPRLQFMMEQPWERITPDLWTYGDLLNTNQWQRSAFGASGAILHEPEAVNEDDILIARHWPMRVAQAPAHGHWWRRPLEKLEDYPWLYETCVSHWSSGGWDRARIGDLTYTPDLDVRLERQAGYSFLHNPGDWPAPTRLAFTNFSRLLVQFRSNGVVEAEVELREAVFNPQYLYVDTATGEMSYRYCPVSDDPCIDLSILSRFTPEASGSAPAPAIVRGELATCIRPGITELIVSGLHAPALPFYWAHDIRPIFS